MNNLYESEDIDLIRREVKRIKEKGWGISDIDFSGIMEDIVFKDVHYTNYERSLPLKDRKLEVLRRVIDPEDIKSVDRLIEILTYAQLGEEAIRYVGLKTRSFLISIKVRIESEEKAELEEAIEILKALPEEVVIGSVKTGETKTLLMCYGEILLY